MTTLINVNGFTIEYDNVDGSEQIWISKGDYVNSLDVVEDFGYLENYDTGGIIRVPDSVIKKAQYMRQMNYEVI